MIVRYTACPVRSAVPALGGALILPRPILVIQITGPSVALLIGVDLSTGMEYRPFLNNNVIFKFGFASLIPGQGFRDLFSSYDHLARILFAGFLEATLTF